MSNKRTMIVAGAGVAGLTVALLLAKDGYRVVTVERSAKVDEAGVGIQLSPNATHVLRDLGLLHQITAASFAPDYVTIKNGHTDKQLSRVPLGDTIVERHGAPYLVLHRADLANILLNACQDHPDITVEFSASLEDAATHSNGVTVMVLKNSEMVEYTGCGLIGADGVNSNVRARVVGSAAAKPSGDIAWRTLIPVEQRPLDFNLFDTTLWMGKKGHVVCYPVRNSRMLNVVAITPQSCSSGLSKRTYHAEPEALKKFYSNWGPEVKFLIDAATEWQGWPLNEINPAGDWCKGAVVLIGDAAHGMLPYAAQGGAAAIEDAVVLTKILAQEGEDVASAFRDYERKRKPRATKIWKTARTNREIYHLGGPTALARDVTLRFSGIDMLQRRFDWLYGWKSH